MSTHSPDRQVTSEEQDLWRRFRDAMNRSEFERISVTRIAVNEVGLHQTRSRQIVSTWENEGLVVSGAAGSYDHASLTEYGRQIESIEEPE